MTFDWFSLFNLQEFLDSGLVSSTKTFSLNGIGTVDILITRGNEVAILYDGVFLPIQFNDENPWVFEGYAVYVKPADGIVYLGIAVEEE